jgi:hypothetical protein
VLDAQRRTREPLCGPTLAHRIAVDGVAGVTDHTVAALARLGLPVVGPRG